MIIVLVPGPRGLYVYVRFPGEPVIKIEEVNTPGELLHLLGIFVRPPKSIILVESPTERIYVDAILHEYDLIVVPVTWMRHLRRDNVRRRARFAARVALSHRADPIEVRFSARPLSIPF